MIELREPFPLERLAEFHHWLASYPTIARTAEFPTDLDEFRWKMRDFLPKTRSFGVFQNGDLIGALILEPIGMWGRRTYIASARRAWGKGWMQEAAARFLDLAFAEKCGPVYLLASVLATNTPALHFVGGMGFVEKDLFPQYVERDGKQVDLIVFELTRSQWKARQAQQAA